MSETLDAQTIGLLGRDKVIEQLHRAGLEVTLPRRDRGIDVIAYADKAASFQALPIQVKASANFRWVGYQKYEPFAELVMAFVMYLADTERCHRGSPRIHSALRYVAKAKAIESRRLHLDRQASAANPRCTETL